MHIQVAHFPFSPLWHRLVGCAMSHRVRSLDRACSGRVVFAQWLQQRVQIILRELQSGAIGFLVQVSRLTIALDPP